MNRKTFFFGLISGVLLTLAIVMIVQETRQQKTFIAGRFIVTHVVDGDTIDVVTPSGAKERVRLVGIDTPETVDPRKRVQCEGPEASARLKQLLAQKRVSLEAKPDEDRDPYGRLLRYVYLDGNDIGAQMISEGYALSICKKFPHPKCSLYQDLQQKAMGAKLGRWGVCGK